MFINLKNGQISVKTYRDVSALATDLADILNAIENNTDEHLVTAAAGAKAALEDGEYLATLDVSQSTVEELHDALCRK